MPNPIETIIGRLTDPTGIFPWGPSPSVPGLGGYPSTPKLSKTGLAETIVQSVVQNQGRTVAPTIMAQLAAVVQKNLDSGSTPEHEYTTLAASFEKQFGTPKPTAPESPSTGSAPAGYTWAQSPDGVTYQLVKTGETTGRSASQEALDAAQAGYYGAQAANLARIAQLAGTAVEGTNGRYIYDQDGSITDVTVSGVNAARASEEARHNLQVELDNQAGTQIAGRNADTQRLGVEQTGRFQQGQLANDSARLGIEGQRLSLDQAKATADIASEQQRNDLQRQEYIRKVLASPSDFVARAFSLAGQRTPSAPITQADLINQINTEYTRLQPGQTLTPPVTGAAPPALAQGGMVRDRMMIVGDPQQQGMPNPEMVYNPTGAPVAVVPMNRMQPKGYAEGTDMPQGRMNQPAKDPMMAEMEAKVKGMARLMQFVENPQTQHMMVDELAQARGRLKKPESVPAYATGTIGSPEWIQSLEAEGFRQTGKDYTPLLAASSPAAVPPGATEQTGSPGPYVDRSSPAYVPSPQFDPEAFAVRPPVSAPQLPRLTPPTFSPPTFSPPLKRLTQDELALSAESQLSDRLKSLFGTNFGKSLPTDNLTPNPRQPLGITPARFPFAMFSPQQLSMLTQDELSQLNNYLAVKYNVSLQDVLDVQKQVYTPNLGRRRGRLVR